MFASEKLVDAAADEDREDDNEEGIPYLSGRVESGQEVGSQHRACEVDEQIRDYDSVVHEALTGCAVVSR